MKVRFLSVGVRGKGVSVDLEPGRATVLFGQNDAGKTNLLEVLADLLHARRDWQHEHYFEGLEGWDPAEHSWALIEGDDDLLIEYIERGPLAWEQAGRAHGFEGQGDDLGPGVAVISGEIERYVEINLQSALDPPGQLVQEVLSLAEELGDAHWADVADDFSLLLRLRLGSRYFQISEHSLRWLCPPPSEWPPEAHEAKKRIAANRDRAGRCALLISDLLALGSDYMQPFVPQADHPGDPNPGGPFVEVPWGRGRPWRVITISSGDEDVRLLEADITGRIPDIGAALPGPESEDILAEAVEGYTAEALRRLGARLARARQLSTDLRPGDRPPQDSRTGWQEWLEEREGWVRIRPELVHFTELLGKLATALAPTFVSERYDIRIEPSPLEDWRERPTVSITLEADEGSFPLEESGSGLKVWAMLSIRTALRVLADFDAQPSVLLIDEPERHLHPIAMEEAASWIARWSMAESTALTVVATHAAPFLDRAFAGENTRYVRLRRAESGESMAETVDDLLSQLRVYGAESGYGWADIMGLHRVVIAVEGVHDELVLRQFFAEDLRKQRAFLLPLHGTLQLTVPVLEFIARFGRPVRVIFDNVRAEALRSGHLPEGFLPRDEERQLRRTLDPLRGLTSEPGIDVTAIPFDLPDIAFALPDECMRKLLADTGRDDSVFPGWEELSRRFGERTEQVGAKPFAIRAVGLEGTISPKTLVKELLARCAPDAQPHPALRDTVKKVLDG